MIRHCLKLLLKARVCPRAFFMYNSTMPDKVSKPVLITLALLNVADYGFTMRAVYILGVPEANPFMDITLGTPLFAVVKLLIVPSACYLLWAIRDKWQGRSVIGFLLLFVIFAYGGVTLWHIYGQLFM